MSRETSCTPENVDAIIARLEGENETGLPITVSQACRGIVDRSTWQYWKEQALHGKQPYAAAVTRIDEARGALKCELIGKMLRLSRQGTSKQSTQFNGTKLLLERLFPEEFDPPKQLELSGKDGGPMQTEVVARVVVLPALDADTDSTTRGSVAPEPGTADPVSGMPRE